MSAFGVILILFFSGWIEWPGILNKDLTVWQDGARTPPKYIWKYIKMGRFGARVILFFLAGFNGQGVLNKDPTAKQDGARPPPIYKL